MCAPDVLASASSPGLIIQTSQILCCWMAAHIVISQSTFILHTNTDTHFNGFNVQFSLTLFNAFCIFTVFSFCFALLVPLICIQHKKTAIRVTKRTEFSDYFLNRSFISLLNLHQSNVYICNVFHSSWLYHLVSHTSFTSNLKRTVQKKQAIWYCLSSWNQTAAE